MCTVNDLFYKVKDNNGKLVAIEGYLGKPEECEILFVLKEPDDCNPSGFWFKDVLDKDEADWDKYEAKYFHVLGTMAYRLRGGRKTAPESIDLKDSLMHCAYINIYPCNGESHESKLYKKTLRRLRRIVKNSSSNKSNNSTCVITENDKEDLSLIAENRFQLIKEMNWNLLATVCGAFEAIVNKEAEECCEGIVSNSANSQKIFRISLFENNMNKQVLSYYHPSHPCAWNVDEDFLHIPACLVLNSINE